jgi:predicted nucleotidyltransferase component of viral defense system
MLQYATVYPKTLECLRDVMKIDALKEFYLVGGTALALQLGHRISVDLDLFSRIDFDPDKLFTNIRTQLTNRNIEFMRNDINTLNLQIDSVKTDIIKFDYPLLEPLNIVDNIRLMSIPDITASKLSAISNRGAKRDFVDMYFLLQQYTLDEIFDFFYRKFNIKVGLHQIKSLVYFRDAERQPDAIMLKKIEWETIKKMMEKTVDNYMSK